MADPKVGDDDIEGGFGRLAPQEEVFRFEVPVDEVVRVDVGYPPEDVVHHGRDGGFGERTGFHDPVEQLASFRQLHSPTGTSTRRLVRP